MTKIYVKPHFGFKELALYMIQFDIQNESILHDYYFLTYLVVL